MTEIYLLQSKRVRLVSNDEFDGLEGVLIFVGKETATILLDNRMGQIEVSHGEIVDSTLRKASSIQKGIGGVH